MSEYKDGESHRRYGVSREYGPPSEAYLQARAEGERAGLRDQAARAEIGARYEAALRDAGQAYVRSLKGRDR